MENFIKGSEYKGEIQINQRIYSGLYNRGYGVITAIHGEQEPATVMLIGGIGATGGRATYDIVFEDGSTSKHLPECVLRGVQWRISSEIVTQHEADCLITQALHKEKADKEAGEAKAEADRRELAALPGKYPHLKPLKDNKISPWALASKNIRTELKAVFPEIKFKVRSEAYTGGNSIDVDWTDGPTSEEVKAITDKYQKGSFDGMTDMYDFNGALFPKVFGGAYYVFENRHHSPELLQEAADAAHHGRPLEFSEHGYPQGLTRDEQDRIYRKVYKISKASPKTAPAPKVKKDKAPAPKGKGKKALALMGL